MAIERFIWTTHAEGKRLRRLLGRSELERAIRDGHSDCQRMKIPPTHADWRIYGLLADGRRFVVAYDHPHYLSIPKTPRLSACRRRPPAIQHRRDFAQLLVSRFPRWS